MIVRLPLALLLSGCTAGCPDRPLPLGESPTRADLGVRDLSVVRDLGGARDLSVELDLASSPDLSSQDLRSPCNGLDEASCRQHKECAADYCLECTCTPTFVACRAPSAPKTNCPGLGCAQPACCSASSACRQGPPGLAEECLGPGEFSGCGFCINNPPCNDDSDCAGDAGTLSLPYAGHVCDDPQIYFLCGGCWAQKLCLPGCSSDAQCVGGRVCSATGHCVWKSCSSDSDCAVNFACATGQCQRISCVSDADCSAGFCVNDRCYESYGTCMPVPF